MVSMVTIEQINQELEAQKLEKCIESNQILEKCVELCNKYSQSVNEFVGKVDSFLINNELSQITLESMGKLEQILLKDYQTKKNVLPSPSNRSLLGKRELPHVITPSSDKLNHNNMAKISELPRKKPVGSILASDFNETSESLLMHNGGGAYQSRTNSGQVLFSMNANLGSRGEYERSATATGSRCLIRMTDDVDFDNISNRYRFMYTTLEERVKALDRHLLKLQSQMCAAANIAEEKLQRIGIPSPEIVWVCGRVCNEASQGKLNKTSVVLEGSRKESGGRRVHLDLKELSGYSLFPGQVILVEGINASGRMMTVRRIIDGTPAPFATSNPSNLIDYHHSIKYQNGQPITVVTAAGPFTTSDNLDYHPFSDFLKRVLKTKPDVVILLGPFVDISQPLLATGDVKLTDVDDNDKTTTHTATYEIVFIKKIFRDGLIQMFDSEEEFGKSSTQFMLIPSLLDAHHEFVFPQPPFGDRDILQTEFFEEPLGVLDIVFSKTKQSKERVHFCPNPCMFRINEILFGVCSNDLLFSLSSDETSLNIEGNRMLKLASHVLNQQSFCPQFPVALNTLAQLDLRQSKHWEFNTTPDVLILPSKLSALSSENHGTLIINPGQLSKGMYGGTIAELHVHPMLESSLRDDLLNEKFVIPHSVASRTCVNIIKI